MAIVNVGDTQEFAYTGKMQSFVAPVDGIYQFDLYGAQGGGGLDGDGKTVAGGKGGHTTAFLHLPAEETVFVCVGGQGVTVPNSSTLTYKAGGYNGGGACKGTGGDTGSGGGATHIARLTGTLATLGATNISNIFAVAGGGGGYSGSNGSKPGTGGGLEGGLPANAVASRTAATQTKAGASITDGKVSGLYSSGSFGQGAGVKSSGTIYGPGAGGGLYGGGSGFSSNKSDWRWEGSSGGGSGYIAGAPEFIYNGVLYAPTTENGKRSGNGLVTVTFLALGKIYNLFRDGEAVQQVFLDGVELTRLCVNGETVFGIPE